MHVCIMRLKFCDGRTDRRTNEQGDSRSWKVCKKKIYVQVCNENNFCNDQYVVMVMKMNFFWQWSLKWQLTPSAIEHSSMSKQPCPPCLEHCLSTTLGTNSWLPQNFGSLCGMCNRSCPPEKVQAIRLALINELIVTRNNRSVQKVFFYISSTYDQ